MKTFTLFALLALSSQLGGGSADLSPGLAEITANGFIMVRGEDDKDIPALEEGVLVELTVRDGARVKEGELIAKIDASLAQAQKEIADVAFEGAKRRAEDDIEQRYAAKQAAVTKTAFEQDLQANADEPGSVAEITVRRHKLDWERSILQVEKAKNDSILAFYDAKSKLAEKKAAQLGIDRRVVRAPFDGIVQTVYQHKHEWVKPGDPVVRLLRLGKVYMECFVSSADYDPIDVAAKPVTVTVNLARGRQETLRGQVVYYSQTTQADGQYLVRAEVENLREGEHWLARSGMPATITIHVSQPAVTARR